MFKANIVIASPASFIEQMAIILQFYELNPFSLFSRRLTLSCDLDADKPVSIGPSKRFRLFPYDDAISFAATTGKDLPGRAFHKPVAPKAMTDHAEPSYQIDFMQFAAGLEWDQRYLPADSPLLASNPKQDITHPQELASRMLGEHWVTSPGYFDPRNFHNNVAAFMDRFGLDLERKSTEEFEHQMPQIYRDVEKSLISMINLMKETPSPLGRLIDFHFQRDVSASMRSAYWQEFSKLWQELNRLIDSRSSDEAAAPATLEACNEALTDLVPGFKHDLRDRLLESPYLAQT